MKQLIQRMRQFSLYENLMNLAIVMMTLSLSFIALFLVVGMYLIIFPMPWHLMIPFTTLYTGFLIIAAISFHKDWWPGMKDIFCWKISWEDDDERKG